MIFICWVSEAQSRFKLNSPPWWRGYMLQGPRYEHCLSMVSCQKGPTRHAYAWQIGPFWHDTLVIWEYGMDNNQQSSMGVITHPRFDVNGLVDPSFKLGRGCVLNPVLLRCRSYLSMHELTTKATATAFTCSVTNVDSYWFTSSPLAAKSIHYANISSLHGGIGCCRYDDIRCLK